MGVVKSSDTPVTPISAGRSRYLAHTDHVMAVVVDFNDGPASIPDPPHSHPHEQVSYVAAGEIILVMGEEKTRLSEGDLFTVPANVPRAAVQTLSPRPLDRPFSPIREDFLKRLS
jgi:quercetin dioxygenase-like cupin family protein